MAKFNWFKKRNDNKVHIFHYGRRMGKTTDIINLASKNKNAVLVVPPQMVRFYRKNNHSILITTTQELLRDGECTRITFFNYEYYVDEAEYVDLLFLKMAYSHKRLKALAFSGTGSYDQDLFLRTISSKNKKLYKRKPTRLDI